MKKQFEFKEAEKGLHQLGGNIPEEFKIPENDFLGGLQYLGKISHKDIVFEWLGFDVNLISPIFLDFEKVIFDYENPNEPKIIYPESGKGITTAYEDLNNDEEIIFEEKKYSLKEFGGRDEDNWFDICGIAGNPDFEQDEETPICPKSKNKMRFLCQITSDTEIKAVKTIKCKLDEDMQTYFDELNFWCDGSLYVFVEPKAKTVCYFIQNT